jgi:adenosylhomocysteine nucleosidase
MTTAILSALPDEQAGLHALLQGASMVQHAGRSFWRGRLHGHAVVLALSGIGKVAAATTATALVEKFGAQRIVFTGVAGALASHVQVGDVVLGNAFMQHDLDVSPLFPRYEVPSYGRSRFDADSALNASLLIAINDHMAMTLAKISVNSPVDSALNMPNAATRVHTGLIASGDRFVSSAAEVQRLRADLPDALCVEMEGAAVAQVCHDYAVSFAAIRTISDRADDAAHVDFAAFTKAVAGPYAVGIVGAWLKNNLPVSDAFR